MTDSSPASSSTGDRVREVVRHELVRRDLTVVRVADLTAQIRRVTLAGDELGGFVSLGPEDHVKVFFPSEDGERVMRDYTPAVFREVGESGGPELDLDFVVHGDTGPATAWATAAEPGSTLSIGGPRGSRLAPRGYRRFVLLADASALPALSRWVEAVRFDAEVIAFVQSNDDRILDYPVPTGDRVAITRIATGEAAALTALAGLHLDADTYVWAAGEATALIPVRRRLRRELGLSRDRVKVDGYWKLGVGGLDHHAPLDPEDPED
ncbi:siderophore-interacting protein [Herbiconiux sp. L3-i23]|uniref:siderophore-interacting protein n=1 Tax=Herbiconiux sp. L3-i23 TaxID=2905871 RepID=UPI002055D4D0|nr:siderophore-interacting protein [Herbiconiux sp. L3-i23]BDI22140.1 siderophore-interacting protein [Herbiconiux sp. L3-i23]